MQSYADVQQHHMPNTGHATSSGPPSTIAHYAYNQQPPYLQPGPTTSLVQGSYYQNQYGNGMPPTPSTATMNSSLVPASLPLPAMSAGGPGSSVTGQQGYPPTHQFDTTGQVAPPGMKPRVTATLWEDEGSLCFQVEAKGVCVARREDNHFINGTKLLNVAGMTRGRRDGILKSEKTRHVVKIGPMHLKGVWIPFERALDFANKEKITEQLYPLFVHDIGALLYHPTNQRGSVGTGNAMAALDRRRPEGQQRYIGAPAASQAPSLHHHHSLNNPSIPTQLQQSPHSIAPHPSSGRPSIDRAHTFPTPPTSASSIIGMNNSSNSYEWGNAGVSNIQGNQPLSIDTGLSNAARSVPTTPATTPPGTMQNIQQYPTSQGYDTSRQMYSAPPNQQGQYSAQNIPRYPQSVQSAPFPKSEMAPPVRAAGDPVQQTDVKPTEGLLNQQTEQVGQVTGDDEADHDHDNEYTHTSAPYNNRASYGYAASAAPGAIRGDHVSQDMTGSPHQNGSGRATPRTTNTGQTQWTSGYATPGQSKLPSSNLYSVMSDTRSTANGNPGPDGYPAPNAMAAGYPSQYSPANGLSSKRIRELDDDETDYGRPASRDANGNDVESLKRRKTLTEGTMGGAVGGVPGGLQRAKTTLTQHRR
ncbi:hypothetical protein MPH_04924 [Macrophomina phaseolina MS6]|uniref:HTH APSES-type domain-containing protein n=1 Tax=Macrophomina phaseolina (strain MS6) TaxID=1126212 RepID=K2RSY7_MACPH|nr:hypothetical protein MPH_04924 [Macrophomina phaseolina MS6]